MPRGIRVCHIGYVEASLKAAQRLKRGDRQYKCKECNHNHWRGETCGLMDGIALGKAIRLMRLVQEMGQQELARAVHISPSYLSLIESGRREPTIKTLRRICLSLYVKPGVLLR